MKRIYTYMLPEENEILKEKRDRLCGPLVRVPAYKSRGPGSIPGDTKFFLRNSGSGTGSTQPRDDNCGAFSRK
jgi:hypothetical protein